ncbi:MAG: DUF1214 domain-containing protein [Rhodospirillaceae bacterium]|nr:DUF1214 domain-containing protein [Rhodospirillaceae bacterium]
MIRKAPSSKEPWIAGQPARSEEGNSLARARKSLCCLLAPDHREAIYYRVEKDSRSRPLRAECNYQVVGRSPDARWWSLTIYDSDFFLIETRFGRHSVNSGNVEVNSDGTYSVSVGPSQVKGAWLPTRGEGHIYLLLRAYYPGTALAAQPEGAPPTTIRLVGQCA